MCVACMAFAVPAKKQWRTFTQSDGSTIELMLVGDENLHYYVTRDNVPVVSDGDNLFCYAKKAGFGIMSTGVLAHEATLRSANENVHVADVAEIESVRPYRKIKGVSGIRKLGEPNHPQLVRRKVSSSLPISVMSNSSTILRLIKEMPHGSVMMLLPMKKAIPTNMVLSEACTTITSTRVIINSISLSM